jgi:hypothetical protein
LYEIVENSADRAGADERLRELIQMTYLLCTSGGKFSLEQTVENAGLNPQVVCTMFNIRQLHQIGHYWGACIALTRFARRFPASIKLSLQCILPYQPSLSDVFESGRLTTNYVHAEIQLLIFYEIQSKESVPVPRVIGTSKAACYLCNLFIKYHGRFFVTKTHGRLHSQWTVPDIEEFSLASVKHICRTLGLIDQEITRLSTGKKRTAKGRSYPKESWLDLPLVPSVTSLSSVQTVPPPAMGLETRSIKEQPESFAGQIPPVLKLTESVIEGHEPSKMTSTLIPEQQANDSEHLTALSADDVPNGSGSLAIDDAYALEKRLSPDVSRVFKSRNRCVEIYVDIEQPRTGIASFKELAIGNTFDVIDVLDIRAMDSGTSIQYNRQERSDELTLHLLPEIDVLLSLRLRWT